MKRKNENNAIKNLTDKRVEEIALDFIVNDKTKSDIQRDYNLSRHLVSTIVKEMNLLEKRERYKERVLEKSLEKCSSYQSKIIYKATEILNNHIEKLSNKMKEPNAPLLSSSEVRDVMSILQIVSKENRLDNEQPTDRTIKEVKVQFPEGFRPITSKREVIVDADYKDVKKQEETKEVEESIEVEIDNNILENPLG
jgi:hypothetical protein